MNKRIAVFTATRAEYGLLYWLMKELDVSDNFDLQVIVSGTHLSEHHGYTIEQIIEDGFNIAAKVDLDLSEKDSRLDVAQAMSKATQGIAKSLNELNSDVIFMLGDRYELLGAASAALVMGVPIFHLHGGEVTKGAYDDEIRHAITKMATWHGVACQEYADRVIGMGEPENKVFNVGTMSLDNIKRLNLLSKNELEDHIKFHFGQKSILVTFHSVTNAKNPVEGFVELLVVLNERKDIHIIFTYPNADHGREDIVSLIDDFVEKNISRSIVVNNLGQLRFLSALQYVNAVVGNSSSGIIEAPLMNTPTLNIGDRQKGRVRSSTIVDSGNSIREIDLGLERVLSLEKTKYFNSIYEGNPSKSILNILIKEIFHFQ